MVERTARILVVDDDPDLLAALADTLADDGYAVEAVPSGEAGVEAARRQTFDVALTDLIMPGMDGAATVAALRAIDPTLPIVVGTAYATLDTAVECMKQGAYDYIRKPYDLDELTLLLRRALDRRMLVENVALLEASRTLLETLSADELAERVPRVARRLLHCDAAVLLRGEDRSSDPPGSRVAERLLQAIAVEAAAAGGPVLVPGREGVLTAELEPAGFTAAVACPLNVGGRGHGLLVMLRASQPCTSHDVWAGSVFAAGAALALENARLYGELERRMRADLDATRSRLTHAERLAGAGRLAAGMAHEINNPLTFVQGNLGMLRDYAAAVRELWQRAQDVASQLRRSADADAQQLARLLIAPTADGRSIDELVGDIGAAVDDSIDGVRRIREHISAFGRLSEAPARAEALLIGDIVDEALVGLGGSQTIEHGRPAGDRKHVRGARADLVAGVRNVVGVLLEERERAGQGAPRLRLDEEATTLRLVAPSLRLPPEQLPLLFDPVLQADPRARRMRFDIRLLIAQQLLVRNGVEIGASADTGSGGTVVTVTFPSDGEM
jgi:CheY-like chemotaxis protein